MVFTREIVFFAATLLAWFTYAVTTGDPTRTNGQIVEISRDIALVLTGAGLVRLAVYLAVDGLLVRIWGIPSTGLMRLVAHVAFGSAAAALVLKYGLDFNIATLLTTSALLTMIIGLAAQSTLAALFAGIALHVERHINIGDIVRVDNRLARVEVIGWRSMTARRMDGILVVVPNMMIAANVMPLFRQNEWLRTEVTIAAPIAVPPHTVADVIRGAIRGIDTVSEDHPISVDVLAINAERGLVDYRVRCYSHARVVDDDPLAPMIRLRVLYAFQRYGLALAGGARIEPQMPLPAILSILASTRRWHDKDQTELEQLVHEGRRFLFAPDEFIGFPRLLGHAIVVILAGDVQIVGKDRDVPGWIEPPTRDGLGSGPGVDWSDDRLFDIETALSHAIGPYARIAVRTAARTAHDLGTVYQQLGALIPDPQQRDEFLSAAPKNAGRDFGPGTVFEIRAEGRGMAVPRGGLIAHGQVEMLAVPYLAAELGKPALSSVA